MNNQKPYHRQQKHNSVLDDFNRCTVITIGSADAERRKNLLKNASLGMGKSILKGKHLSLIFGSNQQGYIEYIILNAI